MGMEVDDFTLLPPQNAPLKKPARLELISLIHFFLIIWFDSVALGFQNKSTSINEINLSNQFIIHNCFMVNIIIYYIT